ncbi:hypothetical protein SNOG_06326 [Parastagonospora nodorum SN15]|nr:hypothetical protein SNOG_06326 [Parastagonospora nodorum SN15]EAT86157.2 hypothetical protein SNOG_06326 [Parastagonospora nodorum SN15]
MLVRQGKPNVLSDGSAVMVTVGSDFGDTHEDDEEPFFEAGGRSVDLVTVLYNNFGHWEQSLKSSFNQDLTKHLAKQSYLPFFDFFPWFVKHKDDFKAASLFAKQYLNITKPYVLLTYGNIPTYAGMKSFQPFTQGAYETEYSKLSKANDSEAYWLKEVMGVPQMASFDGAQGVTLGAECVLIPCFHPGRVGHAGILKTLITRLLAMVSGMAWAAMEYAVTVDHKNPNLPRKQKCEQILGQLNMQLSSNHPFGQAFEKSKSEYAVAQTADWQARFARKKTVAIGKPPRGILATKVQRKAKRSHLDLHAGAMEAIGDSYELNIQHYPWAGGGDKDKRHTLIWTEDDGQVWSIGPVLLPENVLPSDGNDKRFVVFTEGGLDIRNGAGESKGDRKPLLSGNSKTETVPIASLVLTLCEQAHWTLFISHWEDVTGLSVDYVLGSKLAIRSKASSSLSTANEDYYPNSFFAGSKRGLPFTWVYQTVKTKEKYLSIINATLPAQPGDLVWLIDRYIAETLPNGGDIDLVPASVHANSVFAQVASFCMQAKYKNHPHLRTFLAFASMSEMGVDERLVPATAFTNVVEVLFGKFGKKTKTVRTKIANETRTMSRVVLTIGTERQSGVLQEIEEPAFEQDVIIEGDVTDDEGQEDMSRGQKRGFDGDDDGGESSKSGAKALKGKGKN